MSSPVSVTRSPGQTIYAFPDRSEWFSLDDWCFEQHRSCFLLLPNFKWLKNQSKKLNKLVAN